MKDTEIFNQLNNFLENFKAPKTIKIYDYENDRATPINKFLFTEETITIKDQEKELKELQYLISKLTYFKNDDSVLYLLDREFRR